jgi:hypothetical protein
MIKDLVGKLHFYSVKAKYSLQNVIKDKKQLLEKRLFKKQSPGGSDKAADLAPPIIDANTMESHSMEPRSMEPRSIFTWI